MLVCKKKPPHQAVLLSHLLNLYSKDNPPKHVLDCTFGRAGHSLALIKAFPKVQITAIDCDEQAIAYGSSLPEVQSEQIKLIKQNFHTYAKKHVQTYDMILMDLGVSSPQLDEAHRGFSFLQDGPLDMRMDREQDITAASIINFWSEQQLIQLFKNYGDIKNPEKIVLEIIKYRKIKKFTKTIELAQLIQKNTPYVSPKKHPATTWFLALRLVVNQELEGLKDCLAQFVTLLNKEAYFVIISFHSLEDRIVKQSFRLFAKQKQGRLWNKKVLRADYKERIHNVRSRSAKMRIFKNSLI